MLWPIVRTYRRFFAHPSMYRWNKLLYLCSLSAMGVYNYENMRVSGEAHLIRTLFRKRPPGVVLDVGANVGDYSSLILATDPDARIHAFEPHPSTYSRLVERLAPSGARLNNVAVGDTQGTIQLFDHAGNDGSVQASVHRDVIERLHRSTSVAHDVPIRTLDDYIASEDIRRVALLKIDTEGHELAVLRGASRSLGAGIIDTVHLEFNEMNIASGTFFRDIWEQLADYRLFRLLPGGFLPLREYSALGCEIFAYQNVLGIHRRLPPSESIAST